MFKNKILIGYFESEKYFSDIERLIKQEFKPKEERLRKNEKLYSVIENANDVVCVSVRAGDYMTDKNVRAGCYICVPEYFYKAIDVLKKQLDVENLTIIIFSDDIEWAKSNLNNFSINDNVYYEAGDDPVWEKLRLMSSCHHFVIYNSTFSWWAQYLGEYDKKVVIAPTKWRKYECELDIMSDRWIKIDCK